MGKFLWTNARTVIPIANRILESTCQKNYLNVSGHLKWPFQMKRQSTRSNNFHGRKYKICVMMMMANLLIMRLSIRCVIAVQLKRVRREEVYAVENGTILWKKKTI